MNKRIATFVGIVVGFVFVLSGFYFEANAGVPDKVTISVIKDKKQAVVFPHKDHLPRFEGKCTNCHKTATGGGLKAEFTAKPANMGDAMKNPFHTECKGCHTKAGGKAPVTCDGCHK